MPFADHARAISVMEEQNVAAHEEVSCGSAERRGLFLVGCYKLLEALFFIGLGAGALHLIHKDLGLLVLRITDALPVDPEGRIVRLLLDKADKINARDLQRIGSFAFLYAATRLVEGIGLIRRKVWAEYFTVVLTSLGLPVEIYELIRRANWFKFGALVANLAILLYLILVLRRHHGPSAATAPSA